LFLEEHSKIKPLIVPSQWETKQNVQSAGLSACLHVKERVRGQLFKGGPAQMEKLQALYLSLLRAIRFKASQWGQRDDH